MAVKTTPNASSRPVTPAAQHRLLVVEGDRHPGRGVSEALRGRTDCEVLAARTVAEARKIVAGERVTLLITELSLPDGDGLSLLPDLRRANPHATVVVTAKTPKLEDAITAIRGGATDFIPRPIKPDQLAERIDRALGRQDVLARNDRKIHRLREAVRRLSDARRTVSKKVDLLCNDLVTAYGELSRQMDSVRCQEDFRKICDRAKDLEQLLCHAMDWIMRRVGYSNIAVYLAADDATGASNFQLGAYVKYTTSSTPEMTDAIRDGLVQRAGREGFVKLTADEAAKDLTAAELRHLRGNSIVAANCTYLGESLATVVLFRDGATPFTVEDADTFRAIAPIFAIALASQVKGPTDTDPQSDATASPDGEATPDWDTPPDKSKKDEKSDADWWKRGEAPPF